MNRSKQSANDHRKQAVSIRLSRSDRRHVKLLAERLGTRDSDVIRFAIKLLLGKLAPLQDPSVSGRALVPVFLDAGPDLIRHFELDADRLLSIINGGVAEGGRVDMDDIRLIAMSGAHRSHLKLRVAGMQLPKQTEIDGHGPAPAGDFHIDRQTPIGDDPLDVMLRDYLYEKYLLRDRAQEGA